MGYDTKYVHESCSSWACVYRIICLFLVYYFMKQTNWLIHVYAAVFCIYPIFDHASPRSFIIHLPLLYFFDSLQNKNSNGYIHVPHNCIPISLLLTLKMTARYSPNNWNDVSWWTAIILFTERQWCLKKPWAYCSALIVTMAVFHTSPIIKLTGKLFLRFRLYWLDTVWQQVNSYITTKYSQLSLEKTMFIYV